MMNTNTRPKAVIKKEYVHTELHGSYVSPTKHIEPVKVPKHFIPYNPRPKRTSFDVTEDFNETLDDIEEIDDEDEDDIEDEFDEEDI